MIHPGAGHKTPELPVTTSVPGRMFSSYTSGKHEGMAACPGQSTSASGEFGERSCYSGSSLVFQLHFTSSVEQSLEDAVTYPSLGQREPEPQIVISLCIFDQLYFYR